MRSDNRIRRRPKRVWLTNASPARHCFVDRQICGESQVAKMSNVKHAPSHPRRRTRSVGSAPFAWHRQHLCGASTLSDELCSSSTSKEKDCSNVYQSDSDDICGGSTGRDSSYKMTQMAATSPTALNASTAIAATASTYKTNAVPENGIIIQVMESDSLNENSPCRRSAARRKRKYKKIAMEVDVLPPPAVNRFCHPCSSLSHTKKKRIMRISSTNFQNSRLWPSSGKRKRSLREKSRLSFDGNCGSGGGSMGASFGGIGTPLASAVSDESCRCASRDAKVLGISKLSLNDYPEPGNQQEAYDSMEVSYAITALSSSSVSSSGSETGIFTNDEGREGDDEQSDWVGDVALAATSSAHITDHDVDDTEEEEDNEDEEDADAIVLLQSCYRDLGGGTDDDACGARMDADDVDNRRGQSSKLAQLFSTNKLSVNECANRSMRRKIRALKTSLAGQTTTKPSIITNLVATTSTPTHFHSHESDFGTDANVTMSTSTAAPTTGRRHTFSSYKRRKRISTLPMMTAPMFADAISEKTSQSYLTTSQRLSDISSSDSKDSML